MLDLKFTLFLLVLHGWIIVTHTHTLHLYTPSFSLRSTDYTYSTALVFCAEELKVLGCYDELWTSIFPIQSEAKELLRLLVSEQFSWGENSHWFGSALEVKANVVQTRHGICAVAAVMSAVAAPGGRGDHAVRGFMGDLTMALAVICGRWGWIQTTYGCSMTRFGFAWK